jgi:hypothetical protein
MNWRIQTIIDQLGGTGLRGAFVYTGAQQITYKDRPDEMTPDPSRIDGDGVHFDTGIMWKVNGKHSQTWKELVTLEPSDTYTVRLLKIHTPQQWHKTGQPCEVLYEASGVYCDMLQAIAEEAYDTAIKEHNGGFINI